MKRDAGLERMRQEHVKMFLMGSAISIAFFVTIVLTARGYMGWTTFAMIGVILFIGTLYPFNSWIQLEKKLRIRYTREFQIPFIKERTQHLSPKFLDLDDKDLRKIIKESTNRVYSWGVRIQHVMSFSLPVGEQEVTIILFGMQFRADTKSLQVLLLCPKSPLLKPVDVVHRHEFTLANKIVITLVSFPVVAYILSLTAAVIGAVIIFGALLTIPSKTVNSRAEKFEPLALELERHGLNLNSIFQTGSILYLFIDLHSRIKPWPSFWRKIEPSECVLSYNSLPRQIEAIHHALRSHLANT